MKFPILLLLPLLSSLAAGAPAPEHFKVEVLTEGFTDPQEMVMLPDGRILICERTGGLRFWTPGSEELGEGGRLEVAVKRGEHARECGFIGLAADPDFAENHWLYAYHSLPDVSVNRLSRYTFRDGHLDPASEVKLLDVATDRDDSTCHEGGSVEFGPDGLLYLSTGDNTNPFSKPATPIEEDRKTRDAQRSASNSNDLRGKVLRIRVADDGSVSIPEGNLFPPGTPKTRPEIYAMGLRNPYRITINSATGTLYWGEVAPDKQPTGEEINQAKSAGYYGWPYVITDTKVFKNLEGVPFDPEHLRNTSRNNTGIVDLPVPREPLYFYQRSCAIMGQVYHMSDAPGAFPAYYDNCLLFADWNRSWFKFIRLDKDENKVAVEDLKLNFQFRKPIDMFFDKGVLYVLEYGSGWYNVKNGRLLRVSYSEEFHQRDDGGPDPRVAGMDPEMPGTKLLPTATCLSCHSAQDKVIGPSFADVAVKYRGDSGALATLVAKVRAGGSGNWGEQPMPAHPMYSTEQLEAMVRAVLATETVGGHRK